MRRTTHEDACSPPPGRSRPAPDDASAERLAGRADSVHLREVVDALERVREQLAETQATLDAFVARIRDTEADAVPGGGRTEADRTTAGAVTADECPTGGSAR